MEIKPYSSFTDDSLAADFPGAVLLFHADDFDPASPRRWASRVGDVVLNFEADAVKDENGLYTLDSNSVSSVSGTMPTLSGYATLVSIGNLITGSNAVGALNTTIGSASPGPRLVNTGIATSNAPADLSSATTLTGSLTALSADPGRPACQAAYFDLIDTSSPPIARAFASSLSTDVIANGTSTTTSALQIVLGAALDAAATLPCFTTANDGRRLKIVALFDFAAALTANELQLAVAEMARTRELFAGWRNRE